MKKSLVLLSALGIAGAAHAASNTDRCAPVPPAPCYSVDTCEPTFCLGPEVVNPAVRPCTCDGDITFTVAGLYWSAHQDGMEYAIQNRVSVPVNPTASDILQLNNLVQADYLKPAFNWDFGFKLGAGYNTNHDGWDIGVIWTWFKNNGHDSRSGESSDNQTLVALWSAFAAERGQITYANQIDTKWKLQLNLIDIELGREMWMSKYLTFRPFVGIRVAYINQDWNLEQRGGSFTGVTTSDPNYNDFVDLDNDFKGVGLRGGFDTIWNFGRGWGFYGNLAANIVYGKFSVEHDEHLRDALAHFDTVKVLETQENFRASRAMLDMALGVQWATMFSECRYCFTFQLGWEQHLFFGQNQMWRVVRARDVASSLPNNNGENVFHQSRGDLDTQGVTLTLKVGF